MTIAVLLLAGILAVGFHNSDIDMGMAFHQDTMRTDMPHLTRLYAANVMVPGMCAKPGDCTDAWDGQ